MAKDGGGNSGGKGAGGGNTGGSKGNRGYGPPGGWPSTHQGGKSGKNRGNATPAKEK